MIRIFSSFRNFEESTEKSRLFFERVRAIQELVNIGASTAGPTTTTTATTLTETDLLEEENVLDLLNGELEVRGSKEQ